MTIPASTLPPHLTAAMSHHWHHPGHLRRQPL